MTKIFPEKCRGTHHAPSRGIQNFALRIQTNSIMKNKMKLLVAGIFASSLLTLTSCQTHTQKGALYGGAGGAAIGALAADDAGKGALIGGAIGAAGGAAVGSQKDKRERYYYGY